MKVWNRMIQSLRPSRLCGGRKIHCTAETGRTQSIGIKPRAVLCFWLLGASAFGAVAQDFSFEEQVDRLVITHAANPVAHFVFRDAKILRPYFAHVHTPDGIQVTRTHPPVVGKDAVDHDTMHPGIWLAFGDVSGNDFWRNKVVVRHERFSAVPAVKAGQLAFTTESSLLATNGAKLATLVSRCSLSLVGEGFLLTWQAGFTPATDGFYFGDQEEMGFGVRVGTELTEKRAASSRAAAARRPRRRRGGRRRTGVITVVCLANGAWASRCCPTPGTSGRAGSTTATTG